MRDEKGHIKEDVYKIQKIYRSHYELLFINRKEVKQRKRKTEKKSERARNQLTQGNNMREIEETEEIKKRVKQQQGRRLARMKTVKDLLNNLKENFKRKKETEMK